MQVQQLQGFVFEVIARTQHHHDTSRALLRLGLRDG